MSTQVKFDRDTIVGEIAKLSVIVNAIKEKQGSAQKRLTDATHTALGHDVKLNEDMPVNFVPHLKPGTTINLGDLASFVQSLNEWSEQVRKEAVNKILKDNATGDDVAVLREQYSNQKEKVEALLTVAKFSGVDVEGLTVPHLRAGRPKGSTSTKSKTGSKWSRFYRIVNGERHEQGDSQNTFSSFAWYFGAKITGAGENDHTTNNGKGVPTDVLEKFLRNQGVDSPKGKSWSLDVDNVTYGMDVTDSPKATDEEE